MEWTLGLSNGTKQGWRPNLAALSGEPHRQRVRKPRKLYFYRPISTKE